MPLKSQVKARNSAEAKFVGGRNDKNQFGSECETKIIEVSRSKPNTVDLNMHLIIKNCTIREDIDGRKDIVFEGADITLSRISIIKNK